MAGSQSIGNAYINIKPKMDGSFESEIESAGERSGGFFGDSFKVAAGNLIADGIKKVAEVAADTFVKGFEGYADFEQLKGGVEKIFDQANAEQIFKDAQEAYKELNMSANEYMESINKVGATFAQTMGDQKGYDTARTGMKAIADYASGTGANLENLNEKYQLITRSSASYQSIADQFAGILPQTSSDFLEQAKQAGFLSDKYTELTQVPVSEYQEAVTKMLEKGVADMGLAGNTLAESTETISGSLAMLRGSWDNFLAGLFDENANIGALGENLIESVGAVLINIVPRIAALVGNVVTSLPGLVMEAMQQLPAMLQPTIQQVFGEQVGGQINEVLCDSVGRLGESFSTFLGTLLPTLTALWETISPILELIGQSFSLMINVIAEGMTLVMDIWNNHVQPLVMRVFDIVQPVIEKVSASIQKKIPMIQDVISRAMDTIRSVMEKVWPAISGLVETAMTIVSDIISTVWPVVSQIIDVALQAIDFAVSKVFPVVAGIVADVCTTIKNVVDTVWPVVREIIEGACEAISGIIDTVWPVVLSVVETVCNAIEAIVNTVWPVVSGVVETAAGAIVAAIDGLVTIVDTVGQIFDAVGSAITDPVNTASDLIESAVDTIKGIFDFDIQWPDIPLPHFNVWGSPNPLDWLNGDTPGFSIDWYAKGGIVDGATLIGVGEAGPEMILPQRGAMMDRFAAAVASRVGGGVDIHDCTFNVHKESDIRQVAERLNTLINRQTAGGFA